jgi:hypothetical protein
LGCSAKSTESLSQQQWYVLAAVSAWSGFTVRPDSETVAVLRQEWEWLLGYAWNPILFSAIGDVFFVLPAGTVWWLSTATGDLEQVAESQVAFHGLLDTDAVDEWFLPGLVEALIAHGQVLADGQCYSYRIFPVFAQGNFSVENLFCLDQKEHFRIAGQIHRQIRNSPDGSSVEILLS